MAKHDRWTPPKDIPPIELLMKLTRMVGPKDVDLSALETTLLFLRTVDEVIASYNAHFEEFNISDGKFHVLAIYWLHDLEDSGELPPTPSQIAELCRVNRSTITGLLDGLERSLLITRTPHPQDGRSLQIKLTEEGKKFLEEIFPVHIRRSAALVKRLSPEKRRFLISILHEILHGLGDFWEEGET